MSQITNPQLAVLDERVFEFYGLTGVVHESSANLYGLQIYKSELLELQRLANKIDPESEFDNLIIGNILSNLELTDSLIDFYTNPNQDMSVVDFFEKEMGSDSWSFLEEIIQSADWKLVWEHRKLSQKRRRSQVNRYTEEARKAAGLWKEKIKEDGLKHGKALGYLPRDFDMNVFILPPREEEETSYWVPETRTLNLGFYGFEFYQRDGEVIAKPAGAYNALFHEVFGHGAHQILSADLPLSVRLSSEVGNMLSTKPTSEGVAISRESESHDFLRERQGELGIDEEDIMMVDMGSKLAETGRCFKLYSSLLKEREIREGFDSYEHLLNLTNNFPLAMGYKRDTKNEGLSDGLIVVGHSLGPHKYSQMEEEVRKKFGRDFPEREPAKMHRATARGDWSWEVYPDAVCYFLEHED